MPITKVGSTITYTEPGNKERTELTHTFPQSGFAICADVDPTRQLKFDIDGVPTNTSVTIEVPSDAGTVQLGVGSRQALQYAVPLTGETVTIAASTTALVCEPAGTLAELTIVLPLAPANGTKVSITSTQIVTTLTLSDGADSTVGAAVALAANVPVAYVYRSANTTWYRTA